jgi:hypothetical protein
MARLRSDLGNSQLQVGARLRKLSLFLAIAMALSGSSAVAATKKASPTPTVKATVKATAKATPKVSAKPTAKATTKATTKATAKPSAKASAKATGKATSSPTSTSTTKPVIKPKPKPRPRKKISVSPSPRPAWPPAGFKPDSGIYAKVPSSKELVGVISAKGNLATQIEACKKFVCGAVQVAAEQGCLWWEIDSKVFAENKDLIGNLQTVTAGSTKREIKTILLISPEPLDTLEFIDSIEVVCHQDARPDAVQAVTFTKVG